MKGLTDIPGIRVGHVSDFEAITGCTAILCEQGAVGGVDIRGSASGTQEIDTLSPGHVTDRVHGVLFAGGSAFGLEAAAGVRRYLAGRKVGYAFGGQHIPDRKSTRLNSSHANISYAVFCLKKKN